MLMFEEWLYESPVVYILTSVALTSLPQNNLSFSISRNSETLENTKKTEAEKKTEKIEMRTTALGFKTTAMAECVLWLHPSL